MNQNGSLKDLWIGIGITIGIYLAGLVILLAAAYLFFIYLIVAVLALLIIPAVSFAKGKKRLAQGALIGLGLNILLFTACFGIIISGLGGG
ncbi:hypothetical protein [Neobacillus muris]|uniref:hypothetical protein n=1 Tax=Neobacillus muris TaxID=2941334 RepID=UPI00203B2089|nr:hypothetical protein [Neobacillus muris]